MPDQIPAGDFPAIEGEMKFRSIGNQVFVEMDSSEGWYSALTFDLEQVEKMKEWFTLLLLARK